jgi:hypothetical protein
VKIYVAAAAVEALRKKERQGTAIIIAEFSEFHPSIEC